MVKYSGRVILQTGGRGKNVLPANKPKRPTCKIKKKLIKKGGKKSVTYCRNKIYGTSPKGNLCKKHFEFEINKTKNKDKQNLFEKYSKIKLEELYPKINNKNTFKTAKKTCSKCKNSIFKEELCKWHFKNRFFDNWYYLIFIVSLLFQYLEDV